MILMTATDVIGITGSALLFGGPIIFALAMFLCGSLKIKNAEKVESTITYFSSFLSVAGAILIFTACNRYMGEENRKAELSKKYQDVIEVYDGDTMIKKHKGEIVAFIRQKDFYLIKMELPDKSVIEIMEPKKYSLIKKDY